MDKMGWHPICISSHHRRALAVILWISWWPSVEIYHVYRNGCFGCKLVNVPASHPILKALIYNRTWLNWYRWIHLIRVILLVNMRGKGGYKTDGMYNATKPGSVKLRWNVFIHIIIIISNKILQGTSQCVCGEKFWYIFHLIIIYIYMKYILTQCELVMPYGNIKLQVNIGSGNGLVPHGTKPLPEPMLINHQYDPVSFTWKQFHMIPKIFLLNVSLKIIKSGWWAHHPGANELTQRDWSIWLPFDIWYFLSSFFNYNIVKCEAINWTNADLS